MGDGSGVYDGSTANGVPTDDADADGEGVSAGLGLSGFWLDSTGASALLGVAGGASVAVGLGVPPNSPVVDASSQPRDRQSSTDNNVRAHFFIVSYPVLSGLTQIYIMV